jgi:hypothetical protein
VMAVRPVEEDAIGGEAVGLGEEDRGRHCSGVTA